MNPAVNLLVELDDVLDLEMMQSTAMVSLTPTPETQSTIAVIRSVVEAARAYYQSIDGLDIQGGIIRSPGKFETEMHYIPYFWDQFLNGYGTDRGTWAEFALDTTDRILFPELRDVNYLYLSENNDGFVIGSTSVFHIEWTDDESDDDSI